MGVAVGEDEAAEVEVIGVARRVLHDVLLEDDADNSHSHSAPSGEGSGVSVL